MKCKCEDSNGEPCCMEMSILEEAQDGMCSFCADNVYEYLHSEGEHTWLNKDNPKRKGSNNAKNPS